MGNTDVLLKIIISVVVRQHNSIMSLGLDLVDIYQFDNIVVTYVSVKDIVRSMI